MDASQKRHPRQNATRQWSLRTVLPAALVGMVVVAVIPVVTVTYIFADQTASRLLREASGLMLDGIEAEIRGRLDPVVSQLRHAQTAVDQGVLDPTDPKAMRSFAFGLLGGTPQVFGVGLVRPDMSMLRWERGSFAEITEPKERLPFAKEAIGAARSGRSAYWAPPFVSFALADTILNFRASLERDGRLFGVLSAGVKSADLSRYVETISKRYGVTAFILSGRDNVITYPGKRAPVGTLTSTAPPKLSTVPDRVISQFWADPRPLLERFSDQGNPGHWSIVDGRPITYFYRRLTDYGPQPLIVAVAFPSSVTRLTRWAARIAAGLGLLVMLFSACAAWWLGRTLARPPIAIGEALQTISRLEFEKVSLGPLSKSRVKEWRRMASTVELTARSLGAFQTYVPRALVRRLFQRSGSAPPSENRELTVMFIDLEGFTAFSHGRDAHEVAAYLNELFGIIGPIIESQGGVIDKYTGDGLLAFWGAPDDQPDHAERGCRAAAKIHTAMTSFIEERKRLGLTNCRVRVGLHSGRAIVGNIGFPGRINYTLVGETVNRAQRTEAALKGLDPASAVLIAATESVFASVEGGKSALRPGSPIAGAPIAAFRCQPVDLDR